LAQVGEGECGPAELRGLPGGGAQPVDQQVEVAVTEVLVRLGGEAAGQRPGQPDDEQADVAGGDVAAQGAGPVGCAGECLEQGRPGLAGLPDLLVIEGGLGEQGGDDRGGAHVDGPVHVAGQGAERVGFLAGGLVGFLDGALQGVQDDVADERLAVREVPVEGGDPGSCPAGDLVEGGGGAALDEHITGCLDQPAPVVAGVGAQPPPRGTVLVRRHC
jgi:hypothetical protein